MAQRASLHLAHRVCVSQVSRFILTAWMVLVIAVVSPGSVSAQAFNFNSFDVQGNARTTDASILEVAGLERGTTVSAGQVNDALQRLQNSGLFEAVEITPRGGTLVITVVEFPTINRISIEGNRRLDDDELLEVITSTPRRVYSPVTAERDAAAIADAYRVTGRLTAVATPVIIRRDDNRVDLVFEVSEGSVVETQRIAFVGNRDYSDRRLRQVLESTQAGLFRALIRSDTFIEDRIGLDRQLLIDFYQDRGYIDFEVLSVTPELSRDRGAYFVTFNIREGQSYRIGNLSVVSELPGANAADFQNTLRARTGVRYSPRIIDNAITRMENLASDQGLRFVRIEPRLIRNDAALTVDVEFVVSRGERVFVERIDIEGNQTTLDRVIRRQFDVVEGDPLDARQVRAAAERIRATGFFADVQVDGRQGTAPGQVIVDVDVEEQPTGSLGFSASFSTDNGAGLAVNFSENNFLGRGQAVAVSFNTVSGGQSINFSFTEPAFLRRDLALGLSAYYGQTQEQNQDFDTVRYGIGTSIAFPVSENGRLRLFYNFDHDEVEGLDPADDSPILVNEPNEADTSRIGLTYSFDNRDTGLNPNAGVAFNVTAEYAGLGGDTEFFRTRFVGVAETRVAREEVTLRATVEGGMINALDGGTRLANRFSLSSRQMRGFEPFGLGPRDTGATNRNALGGNFFSVARFEAAFPLGLPEEYGISGGVFADFGSVWGLDDTAGAMGEVDDSFRLRSVVGVSIFWDTAIGPLRFNFSRALQAEDYDETREFDFTVEARF